MGISFNVLWVDDDFTAVEKSVTKLESYLFDRGFKTNLQKMPNGNCITPDYVNEFDLLLCDLNLRTDSSGKDLVDKVRENQIFTEIILYSGNSDALYKEMKKYCENDELPPERMSYWPDVKDLWSKIENVVNAIIKKTQDIRQIRGRIISEVVRLEHGLEQALFGFLSNLTEEEQNRYFVKYKKKIIDFCDGSLKKANKIEPNIGEFLGSKLVNSGNVIIMLHSVLDGLSKTMPEKEKYARELRDRLDYISKNIIPVRNSFAHLVEQKDASGCVYFINHKTGGTEDRFDEDRFIALRKDILNQHSIVEDVSKFLLNLM